MKHAHPLLVATLLAALPGFAQAETEIIVGGALNFGFDPEDGMKHTDTTAEGFIEAGINGFHGGLWAGSLDGDPDDDFEYELSLGYGGEAGSFGYDGTFTGYFLDSSGHDHTGFGLELSYALSEQFTAIGFAEMDLDSGDLDREIALEFAPTAALTFWAMVGQSDADDNIYTEIGTGYAFNDLAGVELLYEDSDNGAPAITASLVFETSILSR